MIKIILPPGDTSSLSFVPILRIAHNYLLNKPIKSHTIVDVPSVSPEEVKGT
jgi:hypothetical protein